MTDVNQFLRSSLLAQKYGTVRGHFAFATRKGDSLHFPYGLDVSLSAAAFNYAADILRCLVQFVFLFFRLSGPVLCAEFKFELNIVFASARNRK